MADRQYLDDFIENLNIKGLNDNSKNILDANMKQIILKRACFRLQKKQMFIKFAAIACIILAVISSFIPNTPAYALRQRILSYIPGIGVVQSNDESDIISGVLAEPVKLTDELNFIDIRSAYIKGNTINMTIKTNVGIPQDIDIAYSKKVLELISGETAPEINLIYNDKKIAPTTRLHSGYSFESGMYTMELWFYLAEELQDSTFQVEMEGFQQPAKITLSPVKSGTIPEHIGNSSTIDNVIVFADAIREGEILEVLVSIITPDDYKHPRIYLFDHEKNLFNNDIYLTDQNGTKYLPDDNLRKERDSSINTFYFHVPEDMEGLKLIIPQILYKKQYNEDNIRITMPKNDASIRIDKEVMMGNHTVKLNHASLVLAGNELLPDDFRAFDCLRIDSSATPVNQSKDTILRIIPSIEKANSPFGSLQVSQSIYADLWESNHKGGYSLICFDNMSETKNIIIHFDAEFAMTGPWEIALEQ